MVNFNIRLPDELHEKIRWLAFTERKSQHALVLYALQQAFSHVTPPEEAKRK